MPEKPNILLIVADQLARQALPAYGDRYARTPNIDRIANRGTRFEHCYTPYPLCMPTRAAYWTGRFPHETGVLSNGRNFPAGEIPDGMPTLGKLFSDAGYDAVHFGKTHDAGSLSGFRIAERFQTEVPQEGPWPVNADTFFDRTTTEQVAEYLRAPHASPFIAVADLNNPHNICGYVGEREGPHEDPPVPGELPPPPANLEVENFASLPLPVQYVCCAHRRQAQAAGWSPENYRHYLAAYYHYIERVDREIGLILEALETSGQAGDTLVVFMADHGDGMGGRGLVTKHTTFYDETTRVPFIFAGPGVAEDASAGEPLVSLLDLLPTLCDYAGLAAPAGLWGRSLVPWLKGAEGTPHDYVVSEWHTEWGFTIEPGRMLRTPQFKYVRYREGNGEELYDLESDPGEVRNLAPDGEWRTVLERHRAMLHRHIEETCDPFETYEWLADERWRSHAPGYHNHTGPCAPTAIGGV
jgi:choline-sulfatase